MHKIHVFAEAVLFLNIRMPIVTKPVRVVK